MIHQYKLNGYNIVLDVFSGALHVVDEVAYDIIGMYESASEEEIIAAMMKKYGDREDVNEDEIRECLRANLSCPENKKKPVTLLHRQEAQIRHKMYLSE